VFVVGQHYSVEYGLSLIQSGLSSVEINPGKTLELEYECLLIILQCLLLHATIAGTLLVVTCRHRAQLAKHRHILLLGCRALNSSAAAFALCMGWMVLEPLVLEQSSPSCGAVQVHDSSQLFALSPGWFPPCSACN
jgi:hypothetical protein